MLILNILVTLPQVGYLASLGQARTAEVKRDAIIGSTTISIRNHHKFLLSSALFIYCIGAPCITMHLGNFRVDIQQLWKLRQEVFILCEIFTRPKSIVTLQIAQRLFRDHSGTLCAHSGYTGHSEHINRTLTSLAESTHLPRPAIYVLLQLLR